MNPEEINEPTTALEQTLLERYEKSLERFGNLKALYHRLECENNNLSGRVRQLTTSNKKLTNKIARYKEGAEWNMNNTFYLSNVIERACEISPEVCARIKQIKNEEYARFHTNK